MVFQTFIPNVFATKKNNRGHLDLLLHGIFNLKKCHWFINNDLFGNDNCHIGDNKKIAAGKNTVFGDATTGEYLGEFELFALHWCAASGLFGHKNQQTPFPTSNSVASHRIFFLSAAFGSLIQSHWPDCLKPAECGKHKYYITCYVLIFPRDNMGNPIIGRSLRLIAPFISLEHLPRASSWFW